MTTAVVNGIMFKTKDSYGFIIEQLEDFSEIDKSVELLDAKSLLLEIFENTR